MNKPYWSVVNRGSGEEIIQVGSAKQQYGDDDPTDNRDLPQRLASQWFEEDWEDCKDMVEIKLIT